jgi:hypothetical protein
VWSLAVIEVRSAKIGVCQKEIGINKAASITKKQGDINKSIQLKAPEKSHATEELVGYSLSYKLQYLFSFI